MAYKPRSRRGWNPLPPKSTPVHVSWNDDPMRLHHTVTNFKYRAKTRAGRIREEQVHMRLLQQIAFSRGYSDISYNYVSFPSGRVWVGRGEAIKGAHTLDHNDEPGLALAGNYEYQKLTKLQKHRVSYMAGTYLPRKYGTKRRIYPHCKTYATACPGRHARAAFNLSCH